MFESNTLTRWLFVLVQSLFPQNVKERLLEDKAEEVNQHRRKNRTFGKNSPGADENFARFMSGESEEVDDEQEILTSKPIADLFPVRPMTLGVRLCYLHFHTSPQS